MKKRCINVSVLPFLLSSLLFSCANETETKIPDAKSNQDTILHLSKVNIDKLDSLTAVFASLGKTENLSSYQKNTVTTTILTKDMVTYTTSSTSLEIKNDAAYYQELCSDNSLFSYHHIAYEKNQRIAVQENNEYYCVLASDYASYYGLLPSKVLSNYVLNQNTIKSIEKKQENDGSYSFIMELNESAANLENQQKLKLKEYQNAPNYIEPISFTLRMKSDLTPISYQVKAEYYANIGSYSQMKCLETETATFSRYEEKIAIPNEARLEATCYETPRDILNKNQKAYYQKIMMALMKLDLKNGVLLEGTIPNGNSIKGTVNVHFKVDTFGFMSDPYSAFEGRVDVKINEENTSIIYKDLVLYMNWKNHKIAINAQAIMGVISSLSVLSTSYDSLEINKVEGLEDTYRIILKDDLLAGLNENIVSIAHLLGISLSSPSLEVLITMPSNNIETIRLQLASNDISYGIDFKVSNQKYVTPDDLDTYVSQLERSYQVYLSLDALSKNNETDQQESEAIKGNIYIGLNTLENSVEDMLKVSFDFDLSSSITNLINNLALLEQAPEELKSLKDVNRGRILYLEGSLYILMYKDAELHYFKEINVLTTTMNEEKDGNQLSLSILKQLLSFINFSKTDEGISIYLPNAFIDSIVESLFHESLSNLAYHKLGNEMGYVVDSLFELYKPLDHMELFVSKNKEQASALKIWKKDVLEGEVYDKEKDYPLVCSVHISLLKTNETEEDFSFDIEEEIDLEKRAQRMRKKIDDLNTDFALNDGYYQQLVKVNNEYKSLSEKVKNLVYNGEVQGFFYNESTLENLLKRYNNQKQEVEDFMKDFSSLGIETVVQKVNSFTKAQKNYIKESYSSEWEQYTKKRSESEVTKVQEIEQDLKNYVTLDLETATETELYENYKTLCLIQDKINQCLDESLSQLDLTDFKNYSQQVYEALVNKFMEYVDSSIKRIKEKDSATFSSLETALLFQKEMEEHYQKFYQEIVSSSLYYLYHSDNTAYALEAEYLNYMRLRNPNGWEANCINLIENAISEVIQNNETDQEKINQIQEALSYVHTKNISNYNEWEEYLRK